SGLRAGLRDYCACARRPRPLALSASRGITLSFCRTGFMRPRPSLRPPAPRRSRRGRFSPNRDRGAGMAPATQIAPQKESFAALLDESMGVANSLEGTVVKGRVISIENDTALIDVGLKSEGRVPLKEFAAGGQEPDIHVGDTVEVFLERMEDKNGEAQLSREKARREEAWTQLEKSFQVNER